MVGIDEDLAVPLRTSRFGLRFDDPETEAGYRRWYKDHAVGFTRLGMVASVFGWLGTLVGTGFVEEDWQRRLAPGVLLGVMPMLALGYAASHVERLRARLLDITAAINAVAGLLYVGWVTYAVLRVPAAIASASSGVAFFALLIFRLHPARALFAATSYCVLAQALLVALYRDGVMGSTELVVLISAISNSVAAGFIASLAIERVTRSTFRAERLVEAQARVISEERERSEALLRNVLPEEIAERLKHTPGTIADDIDAATVLFADIVGFTPLAARMTAQDVVAILDEVFTQFDDLADTYQVEKIKTIGDAYMAVAGVPTPRFDHVSAVANLALDMLGVMTTSELDVRIGIATGPLVAGVIGRRKFSYDLWGDTVNTASRLESHGVPGAIQVTSDVREALGSAYEFEDRGNIELKGKGSTRAHLLVRRRVEVATACVEQTLRPSAAAEGG